MRGRKGVFTPCSFISCTTSGSWAQRMTSCPFLARRLAKVVPQLPAPITAIFSFMAAVSLFPLILIFLLTQVISLCQGLAGHVHAFQGESLEKGVLMKQHPGVGQAHRHCNSLFQ